LIERCCGSGKRIEQAEAAHEIHLIAADLLHAKLRRVDGVAVDERDPIAGAAEDDGGERTAEPPADDRNLCFDDRHDVA
jgi:hypothetical protein